MSQTSNAWFTSEMRQYVVKNELHYSIRIVLPFSDEIGEDEYKVKLAVTSYRQSIHDAIWSEYQFDQMRWVPFYTFKREKVIRVTLFVINLGYKPLTAGQMRAMRAIWNNSSDSGGRKCVMRRSNIPLEILNELIERGI